MKENRRGVGGLLPPRDVVHDALCDCAGGDDRVRVLPRRVDLHRFHAHKERVARDARLRVVRIGAGQKLCQPRLRLRDALPECRSRECQAKCRRKTGCVHVGSPMPWYTEPHTPVQVAARVVWNYVETSRHCG